MSHRVEIDLDGKKAFENFDHVEGIITGIALQTNEHIGGNGQVAIRFRVAVPDDEEPLIILADIDIAVLVKMMTASKERLQHLAEIREMAQPKVIIS